ncbi:MAG: hypothetical protein ACRDND_19520 [Streptosporangiaceae bacterium]
MLADLRDPAAILAHPEVTEPGLVYLPLWRPDGASPDLQEASGTGMFGGVGRKDGGRLERH